MEKREEKIDLLKGLATVLVVIGHNIAYGSGITYLNNENFYDNFLFKVIYSFHMPLFMLLSGYVFLFSINRYDPIKIIFRKVRQLLLPVFSWQTIWYIAFMVCKGGTFSVKGWFVSCLNSIWFLWAAFFAQ